MGEHSRGVGWAKEGPTDQEVAEAGLDPAGLDAAAQVLLQYLMPQGGVQRSAEQVGVQFSQALGLQADAFEVGQFDEMDAELDRMVHGQ